MMSLSHQSITKFDYDHNGNCKIVCDTFCLVMVLMLVTVVYAKLKAQINRMNWTWQNWPLQSNRI